MPNRRDHSEKLKSLARGMRKDPSEPERVLWWHLRKNQLGGYKFRRQVPILGRIADFACMEKMVIVEADGSQHFEGNAEELDAHRDADLARVGWKVLRFQSTDILRRTRDVLATILAELNERPTPQPPVKASLLRSAGGRGRPVPSPACGGGLGRGSSDPAATPIDAKAQATDKSQAPPPNPLPQAEGGDAPAGGGE